MIDRPLSRLSDQKKLKIISIVASGLSGFFGAAGALVFNWMVQWWLGREMKRVNGLALFTISISAVISILTRIVFPLEGFQINNIHTTILFISIICGIVGVMLGKIYEQKLKEKHLRQLFIVILLFVGLKLLGLIPAQLFSSLPVHAETAAATWSLIAGISSPPLGMGAGVFLVPTFLGIGFSREEAIFTSLVVSAILMMFGAWLFRRARQLDSKEMQSVWLPAVIGAPIGVLLSYQISPGYFQTLFGILLIIGAGKTFYDISPTFRRFVHLA